ncbi:DUF177 domain-containing protein [Candidatus Omnitrophota bacterium]
MKAAKTEKKKAASEPSTVRCLSVDINKIPPEGLEVYKECNPAQLELDVNNIHIANPLRITAHFFRGINNISAEVQIDASATVVCDRCLEEFQKNSNIDCQVHLCIEPNTHTIDITEDLRQEIILSYPMKSICKSDCKGLCIHCGENLNIKKCNCNNTTKERT